MMSDETAPKKRRKAAAAPPPEEESVPAAAEASPDAAPEAEDRAETEGEALAAEAAEPADGDTTPMAWHEGDDVLRDMMAQNFIEYASYVIKDRAIPDINDGLKPVQRRIMHTLWEHDDGRFHKVANIVGATMRFHPHGDASIYSALVVLANKEYFVDRQGNFGNIYTGDPASAARYIECRLSPLAREVMFNPEITEYVDSYDGRNREPVTLPAKVPAVLMLGADGIAVGMSTTIFPHNFNELLRAQIAILRDEPFHVYPDFLTGGSMDVGDYADGAGRIRVRAKIETVNDKTLVIREIPAGTTTESLIASIEKASRNGKIKISSINDYTAENAEIEITLPRGIYAAETVKLLYAYTDCEVSLTSNLLVIRDNRPVIMTVSDILRYNTEKLVNDLQRELEIELGKLNNRFYEKTLAQLFIEHRIYKRIEKCETLEAVQHEVREGMEKLLADYFKKHEERFRVLEYHGKTADIPAPQTRGISAEDIEKLLQIQIRRISLFDINKNQQEIDEILQLIAAAQDNLRHLKRFTIKFIEGLLKKYGGQFPRRTQITDLAEVNVREVALRNLKVGHDRSGQFAGYGVKNSNKDQEPLACSEFDRLVLLRNDGGYKVVPVAEKIYVGPLKYVLLADREQVYSMIYRDRRTGAYYAKRFRIDSYIMEKEYSALPDNCIIEAFYTNYGVQVRCEFEPRARLKNTFVDVNFEEVEIRAAAARGFKIAEYEIRSFTQTRRGSASPQGPEEPEPPPAAPDGAGPETSGGAAAPTTPPQPAPAADAESAAAEEKEESAPAAEPVPEPAPTGRKGGKKPVAEPPAEEPEPEAETESDENFDVHKAVARRRNRPAARAKASPEAEAPPPAKKPLPNAPAAGDEPVPAAAAPQAKPARAPRSRDEKPAVTAAPPPVAGPDDVPAPASPSGDKPSLKKRIDEDSPFFLE